jgi:hypothetical protein
LALTSCLFASALVRTRTTWSKNEYVRVSKKIYKAMIEEYDEAEAVASAHEDWERDCKGQKEMSQELWEDGLFELADLWTDGIDGTEYAEFLW